MLTPRPYTNYPRPCAAETQSYVEHIIRCSPHVPYRVIIDRLRGYDARYDHCTENAMQGIFSFAICAMVRDGRVICTGGVRGSKTYILAWDD